MKKLSFFVTALTLFALGFTSCKPEPEPEPDIILDGMYLYGDATALDAVASKGMFAKGLNEADKNVIVPGLWEKYIALEANKDFVIAEVKGATTIVYGADSVLVNDSTKGEDWSISGAVVKRGSYVANGTKFQVKESGIYHVVVYTPKKLVCIIPVKWRLNSMSAPSASGNVFELSAPTFNKQSMSFSLQGVEAKASNFKFQSYDGWKYVVDAADNIKVNCNFGAVKDVTFKFDGTANQLLPGGSDIAISRANKAIYTVSLDWALEKGLGFTAKLTKTGNVDLPDPATYSLGLIGGAVGSWDVDVPFTYVPNTSWQYRVSNQLLLADGFKVRTVGKWDDINLGYDNVTITGDVANFEKQDGGNIKCKAETTYKTITLSYDGDTDKWSLDFVK